MAKKRIVLRKQVVSGFNFFFGIGMAGLVLHGSDPRRAAVDLLHPAPLRDRLGRGVWLGGGRVVSGDADEELTRTDR